MLFNQRAFGVLFAPVRMQFLSINTQWFHSAIDHAGELAQYIYQPTTCSLSDSLPCSSNQPVTSSDRGQADKPHLWAVITLVRFPNPFLAPALSPEKPTAPRWRGGLQRTCTLGPLAGFYGGGLSCKARCGMEGAAESITVSALYHRERCLPAPETTLEKHADLRGSYSN